MSLLRPQHQPARAVQDATTIAAQRDLIHSLEGRLTAAQQRIRELEMENRNLIRRLKD